MSNSELGFIIVVGAIVVQRLAELRRSHRNEIFLRAQGAIEHASHQLFWMKLLHTTWILAMLVELWVLERPFDWSWASVALAATALGQALRYMAISELGSRWTVRILTIPGALPVDTRAYRFIRHPNYLGVQIEIVAVPLIHGAWVTALAFGVGNAVLLAARIRAEEEALAKAGGYTERLGDRPRFVPWRLIAAIRRMR